MNFDEIKNWAKQKLSENFWYICGTVFIANILTSLTITTSTTKTVINGTEYTFYNSINIGALLYFISVGLVYYLVKIINNEKAEFSDIFHFSKDFLRCLGAILLQVLWVLLYMLLLIIPGIIKEFGYALVPHLLADEKYKDMSVPNILKKSEEMMYGHKMDLFLFELSFFPWLIVVIITCGLGAIYVIPYYNLAVTKFLNSIKVEAEEKEGKVSHKEAKVEDEKEIKSKTKSETKKTKTTKTITCPGCGKTVKANAEYCSECGTKLK